MPGSLTELWQKLTALFREPHHRETERLKLADGTPVLIRPIVPEDAPHVAQALADLSGPSRYHRFLQPVERLTPAELEYLTRVDGTNHIALGMALALPGKPPRPIGICRSIRDTKEPDLAEVAITVADDFHRRGVARLLLQRLAARARESGILRWRAVILAENHAAFGLFDRLWRRLSEARDGPVVEVIYGLDPPTAST